MPTNIKVYNQAMGGTDKFDQLGSYYDDRTRRNKWQKRIYSHFLRASVVNAMILYNSFMDNDQSRGTKSSGKYKPLTLLQFTEAAILEWCQLDASEQQIDEDEVEPVHRPPKKHNRRTWRNNPSRLTGQHWPEQANFVQPGVQERVNCRGLCQVCNQSTRFKCSTCNVYVCVENKGIKNCFKDFHTLEKY